jgi:hypothetical protein
MQPPKAKKTSTAKNQIRDSLLGETPNFLLPVGLLLARIDYYLYACLGINALFF